MIITTLLQCLIRVLRRSNCWFFCLTLIKNFQILYRTIFLFFPASFVNYRFFLQYSCRYFDNIHMETSKKFKGKITTEIFFKVYETFKCLGWSFYFWNFRNKIINRKYCYRMRYFAPIAAVVEIYHPDYFLLKIKKWTGSMLSTTAAIRAK